ncbi:uncharacterized protein LOC111261301 [Varroa jacobsoni]|uniref:uncharacterized protein LOC111261301 n=1 Tax=Varroa jacobsoni TaxID=62625 RepID=UPI000BF39E57|nr:uncharacterized protein LOC111261301 [Varroa jacobsoni]
MKTFVCIAVLVATAHAGIVGIASTGASSQHRSEDGLGNYAFAYDEGHATGGTFRKESGNALGVKIGSYGLRDADGRVRTVNYVADAAGFRASVSTNEPGTAPSLPAAAAYNGAPVAKVAVATAPVVAAASYAAPVAVAAPAVTAPAYAAPLAAPAYAAPLVAPAYAAPLAAPAFAAPLAVSAGAPAQYAANVFAPSGAPWVLAPKQGRSPGPRISRSGTTAHMTASMRYKERKNGANGSPGEVTMKTFICIAAFVATAHAGIAGIASTGASSQHRSEDGLGNYAFAYDEGHATGGTFRKESGNALGVKIGSYGLRDADGRIRTVNYVADAAGFRASVSTNEPGTAPSLPAAAAYNGAPVAKVAIAAAPVVASASHAAPVAIASPAIAVPAYATGLTAPVYTASVAASVGIPANYVPNVFTSSGTPW